MSSRMNCYKLNTPVQIVPRSRDKTLPAPKKPPSSFPSFLPFCPKSTPVLTLVVSFLSFFLTFTEMDSHSIYFFVSSSFLPRLCDRRLIIPFHATADRHPGYFWVVAVCARCFVCISSMSQQSWEILCHRSGNRGLKETGNRLEGTSWRVAKPGLIQARLIPRSLLLSH